MRAQSDKLHKEAAECETKSKLATDKVKREMFARLAEHYRVLAREVEHAIIEQEDKS